MNPFLPAAFSGLASALLLWGSLRLRRRQRLLHDLPTSKTAGVFIGLVELQGTAESEAPLTSYLSEEPCVHYAFTVQEHWSRTVTETYTDGDGKPKTRTRQENGWTTVRDGGESQAFYLKDDAGAVLIRPEGASIEPTVMFDESVSRGDPLYYARGPESSIANSDHRRRFVEQGIPVRASLYIVGQARERADIVAAEIAEDRNAPLFLISTRSEKRVQRGYAAWSWVCHILALAAAGGSAAIYAHAVQVAPVVPVMVGVGIYLLAWGLSWTWMVFNSLVSLRARVRQAWSLIDVQLKRRHDLIPSLVTAIDALSSHERVTQSTLAALRAQQRATPAGREGPDYEGLAGSLLAVVEAYPEIKAHQSFVQLQQELVSTEQRIALARGYYNDIATQFATRLERIPDGWVGRLVAMKPEPLLAAANFERASVTVAFSGGGAAAGRSAENRK